MKEHRCKFKTDKITYSESQPIKLMTLKNVSLHCSVFPMCVFGNFSREAVIFYLPAQQFHGMYNISLTWAEQVKTKVGNFKCKRIVDWKSVWKYKLAYKGGHEKSREKNYL